MDTLREKRREAGRKGGLNRRGFKSLNSLERAKVFEAIKSRGAKLAQSIIGAQALVAMGTHTLMRIDEVEEYFESAGGKRSKRVTKKLVVVTDPDELERVYTSFGDVDGSGIVDDNYYFVTHEKPNPQAGDSILNRTFGRPTENVELSGRDGKPLIIMLDK